MIGTAALVTSASLLFLASADPAPSFDGRMQGDTAMLNASAGAQAEDEARFAHPNVLLTRYMRAPMCNVPTTGRVEPGLPPGGAPPAAGSLRDCAESNQTAPVPTCVDGPALLPLWSQTRQSVIQSWEGIPWELALGYSCPEDAVPTMTEADFRRLPIAAPVLRLQPDRGWVLVNKETIVMTDPAEQTFRTELLGYGIDVVAGPASYRYDFGDGSRDLVTTSPGHEWPHHDTYHVYEALGSVQVTLTTTWAGRYRVDGTTVWRDVVGTAATSTTSAPFTVEERRSRLVDDLCTDVPTPDDC